jgi:hypothetical protein
MLFVLIVTAILVCIAWALFSHGMVVLGIIPCLLILMIILAACGKLDSL